MDLAPYKITWLKPENSCRNASYFTISSRPVSYGLICPNKYFRVNGNKCLRVGWEILSHLDAEKGCTSDGGTLVTVKTAEENEAVRQYANDAGIFTFWIGLYCPDFNNTFICLWDTGSGSTASYSNFRSDWYPSEMSKCVTMQISQGDYYGSAEEMFPDMDIENDGKWQAVGCSYSYDFFERQYICEVPSSNAPHAGSKSPTIYDRYTPRFAWLDGSNWDFEYFDPLDTNEGDCVVMDVQDHGLWRRATCDQALHYHCKNLNMVPGNELPVSNIITPPMPDLTLSNCNSTLLIGPGSISTLGFPSAPQSSCTWNIMVLGAYQVGLFFDKWETSGTVKIYDEFGVQFSEHGGQFNNSPFSEILNCNSAKVTFQPGAGSGGNVDKGFHAVVLPI